VDSDLGQTEVAATPALPAVTRNFLAEAWWELSDKLMSLYCENLPVRTVAMTS
jgi:hypothetical protein